MDDESSDDNRDELTGEWGGESRQLQQTIFDSLYSNQHITSYFTAVTHREEHII